jgi:type 1 glutamine amidotransferase
VAPGRWTSCNYFSKIETSVNFGGRSLARGGTMRPAVSSAVGILLGVILLVPAGGWGQEKPAAPLRQRILLLGQKPDGHPPTTHEYMAGLTLFAKLLARIPGVQTILIQADSPWKDGAELLDGADGVVVFLSEGARWVTEDADRLAAFQRLAKRGGSLSCLHWGMGTREAAPIADFTALFGACHGGPDRKYKVVSLTARPADNRHPALHGLTPFEVRDEFYYALKQPAPERMLKVTPLLQVSIDDRDHTVAWAAERPDGGRSFGFSGLHFHENWKLPEYRRLVLQGVVWTLKRPVPEGGLSVGITDADLKLPAVESKP